MQIEKIANPKVEGYNYDPGLTDFFYDGDIRPEIYMGDMFSNVCSVFGQGMKQRFELGKLYGRDGIDINRLLTKVPDDTYYEICGLNLLLMPKQKCIYLLKNYNVIIHDHMEGLSWLVAEFKDPIELIKEYNVIPRNVIISSCAGDDVSVPELNIRCWYIPIWWMIMYSKFPHNLEFKYKPTKLGLVPARKPRNQRIKILAKIHEKGLLDQCDWSLVVNMHDSEKTGDFFKSPSLHHSNFPLLFESDEPYIKNFYNDIKEQLPKYFSNIPHDKFEDNHLFDLDWMGQYCYYVNTETLQGKKGLFSTEKTFKGFMLGLPMLNSASAGFDKFLNRLGFLTIGTSQFDHLAWDERSHSIVDYMSTPVDHEYNRYVAEHNFKIAHDIDSIFEVIDKEVLTRQ